MSDDDELPTLEDLEPPAPPPDVAAVAAREMIYGATKSADLLAAAKSKGAFAILISPASEWSEVILEEWQTAVLERAKTATTGTRWGSAKDLHTLVPDGDRPKYRRGGDDNLMSEAVSGGYGALIVTHDINLLTATERAAADLIVTIPQLTGEQLLRVADILGAGPPPPVHGDLPVSATPAAMRLSARPGNTAAEFLARLTKFVSAIETAKPTIVKPVTKGLVGLHGMDEAVAWGMGLSKDIKAYSRGEIPWSSVSPGCLLSGPPGVGKSTYAYRLASECQIPIVITSYSEWQSAGKEGHLGELLKCLRSKFEQARKLAPSILFIDELDSVQSRNIGGSDNTNAWFTAIINALLYEFGNPQSLSGVCVVAASNYADKVDSALRRAGRLDVEIKIGRPDLGALNAILAEHMDGDLVGADLSPVAQRLLGGTGADAEKAVRGARRRARHADRPITVGDVLAEVGGGSGHQPSRRTAVHEAGHAVVVATTRPLDIIALSVQETNGQLGGLVVAEPADMDSTAEAVAGVLREILAGRAAEEVVFGHVSGGSGGSARSDLAKATLLAVSADLSWGLGKSLIWHGELTVEDVGRLIAMRPDVAARAEARMNAAYNETLTMIRGRRRAVDALADALMAREVLSGAEVREVLASAAAAAAPKARIAPAVREVQTEAGMLTDSHDGPRL